jgi:hypothetical protein
VTAALFLATSPPARAQPITPAKAKSAAPKAQAGPNPPAEATPHRVGEESRVAATLYMVVQVKREKSVPPGLVRDAIIDAKDALNDNARAGGGEPVCEFETPVIRMINETIFREFAAFADQEPAPAQAFDPADARASKVRLQPIPSRDSLWEFDLNTAKGSSGGGERDLLVAQELTIERKSGKKDTYKPVRLAEAKPNDDFRMVVPGSYLLRLDQKDAPVRYEIKAQGIVSSKEETIREEWPESDQFFVITLRNFRGDRQRLFMAVQNKVAGIRIANPLDDVRLDRDFLLTFASLGGKFPATEPEFEPGKYVPAMPKVPGRDPNRAWILFPLTKEQVGSELAKLRDLDASSLPAAIRASGPSLAAQEQELEITPGMRPRWIELASTSDGQRFRRELTIKDYRGLQATLPEVWRLEVYELEANGKSRAIYVAHPERSKEGVIVAERPIRNWPGAIESGVKGEELVRPKPAPDR